MFHERRRHDQRKVEHAERAVDISWPSLFRYKGQSWLDNKLYDKSQEHLKSCRFLPGRPTQPLHAKGLKHNRPYQQIEQYYCEVVVVGLRYDTQYNS